MSENRKLNTEENTRVLRRTSLRRSVDSDTRPSTPEIRRSTRSSSMLSQTILEEKSAVSSPRRSIRTRRLSDVSDSSIHSAPITNISSPTVRQLRSRRVSLDIEETSPQKGKTNRLPLVSEENELAPKNKESTEQMKIDESPDVDLSKNVCKPVKRRSSSPIHELSPAKIKISTPDKQNERDEQVGDNANSKSNVPRAFVRLEPLKQDEIKNIKNYGLNKSMENDPVNAKKTQIELLTDENKTILKEKTPSPSKQDEKIPISKSTEIINTNEVNEVVQSISKQTEKDVSVVEKSKILEKSPSKSPTKVDCKEDSLINSNQIEEDIIEHSEILNTSVSKSPKLKNIEEVVKIDSPSKQTEKEVFTAENLQLSNTSPKSPKVVNVIEVIKINSTTSKQIEKNDSPQKSAKILNTSLPKSPELKNVQEVFKVDSPMPSKQNEKDVSIDLKTPKTLHSESEKEILNKSLETSTVIASNKTPEKHSSQNDSSEHESGNKFKSVKAKDIQNISLEQSMNDSSVNESLQKNIEESNLPLEGNKDTVSENLNTSVEKSDTSIILNETVGNANSAELNKSKVNEEKSKMIQEIDSKESTIDSSIKLIEKDFKENSLNNVTKNTSVQEESNITLIKASENSTVNQESILKNSTFKSNTPENSTDLNINVKDKEHFKLSPILISSRDKLKKLSNTPVDIKNKILINFAMNQNSSTPNELSESKKYKLDELLDESFESKENTALNESSSSEKENISTISSKSKSNKETKSEDKKEEIYSPKAESVLELRRRTIMKSPLKSNTSVDIDDQQSISGMQLRLSDDDDDLTTRKAEPSDQTYNKLTWSPDNYKKLISTFANIPNADLDTNSSEESHESIENISNERSNIDKISDEEKILAVKERREKKLKEKEQQLKSSVKNISTKNENSLIIGNSTLNSKKTPEKQGNTLINEMNTSSNDDKLSTNQFENDKSTSSNKNTEKDIKQLNKSIDELKEKISDNDKENENLNEKQSENELKLDHENIANQAKKLADGNDEQDSDQFEDQEEEDDVYQNSFEIHETVECEDPSSPSTVGSNEIIDEGEFIGDTDTENDEEEEEDESDDSFIVSDNPVEELLSGTGDDLSDGFKSDDSDDLLLSQSASAKKIFNEKQKQKSRILVVSDSDSENNVIGIDNKGIEENKIKIITSPVNPKQKQEKRKKKLVESLSVTISDSDIEYDVNEKIESEKSETNVSSAEMKQQQKKKGNNLKESSLIILESDGEIDTVSNKENVENEISKVTEIATQIKQKQKKKSKIVNESSNKTISKNDNQKDTKVSNPLKSKQKQKNKEKKLNDSLTRKSFVEEQNEKKTDVTRKNLNENATELNEENISCNIKSAVELNNTFLKQTPTKTKKNKREKIVKSPELEEKSPKLGKKSKKNKNRVVKTEFETIESENIEHLVETTKKLNKEVKKSKGDFKKTEPALNKLESTTTSWSEVPLMKLNVKPKLTPNFEVKYLPDTLLNEIVDLNIDSSALSIENTKLKKRKIAPGTNMNKSKNKRVKFFTSSGEIIVAGVTENILPSYLGSTAYNFKQEKFFGKNINRQNNSEYLSRLEKKKFL